MPTLSFRMVADSRKIAAILAGPGLNHVGTRAVWSLGVVRRTDLWEVTQA